MNLFGKLLLLFIFILSRTSGSAQPSLHHLQGLLNENVYNLYSDKKGFLWIGHDLGVARFDGKFISNFANDSALNLGSTDITEDSYGRIWYHNFIGQIFYIDGEKNYMLTSYDWKKENKFPVIMCYKNELVATSNFGLFSCNTNTLSGKYLTNKGKNLLSNSISICNDTLIVMDNNNQFYRKDGNTIVEINFINKSGKPFLPSPYNHLAPLNYNDTIIMYNNNASRYYVLRFKNNQVELLSQHTSKSYINTVRLYQHKIWIHTKANSFNLNNSDTINAGNLTDLVTDQFNNTWYASLQNGVNYFNGEEEWKEENLSFLEGNDFVRCLNNFKNYTIYGTQSGKIVVVNNNSSIKPIIKNIPSNSGSVENIFVFPNNRILVAASLGTYIYNFIDNRLYEISINNTLKTIDYNENKLLLGYSNRLEEIKITDSLKYYLFNKEIGIKNENQYINQIRNAITQQSNPIIPSRTYHVSISKKDGTIYSASKGDLYSIRKSGITKILFKNQSLAAQSLAFWKDNLLIGTLNKGLLMLDKTGHFTELNKNAKTGNKIILDCKVRNDTAFIYEPGYIELIDLNTNISIQTIPIPQTAQGSIYNFIIEKDYINVTTSKKVYRFKLVPNKIKNVPLYILEANYFVNGTSNMLGANIPDNAEFIEVRVSSPYYNLRDNLNIQFTLKYSGNEKWESIPYTNKPIRLYPTKSGDYEFICRLQMNDQSITDNDIKLKFNKKKAYWQTALFISTSTICILLIIYSLYKRTVKSVNKKNAQLIYQLNLENQLIESSITSIKAQMNPHFIFNALNTIQSFIYNNEKNNASNYLGKFSGLIRNILDFSQKSKIPLNEEINLIENYCFLESKRFSENELIVTIEIEKNIETETIQIPPLLIQPFIENSFKHGLFHKEGQKTLLIQLKMEESLKKLIVTINDNGIGRVLSREINEKNPKQSGFGIKANEKRIELINKIHPGSVSICFTDKYDDNGNSLGTTVKIEILITT